MSKKRIPLAVMDDGRIVPDFYKRDIKRMQYVTDLLGALPAEGMGQAKVAVEALQNVLDGNYDTVEDAPEE